MAHITDLGFTREELDAALLAGDVRLQRHPEFCDLAIYNYTEDVQYRNKWNKVTLACRGLIIDESTDEIVARPWEKFFNFGQMDNRIDSTAPVEVTDKMDGSLGILYRQPDGKLAIATRGSFASEQAIHATQKLYESSMNFFDIDEYTFLFEIIYPENRIVVNYGDLDELVLLGGVHKERGYYIGPQEAQWTLGWKGQVTEVFHAKDFVSSLSLPDRAGKEGYVIRSGRNIVKLKQADYVELHRIVTNLSPKTIWEMLGDGKTVADICAGIPDEFHEYVEDIGDALHQQASDIYNEVNMAFIEIIGMTGQGMSRKQFAEKAKRTKYASYLFSILDGRSIRDEIWKNIKPRGDVKTLVEDNG